tara:strand:+ start:192 stop:389 length:198 start_codon:yes stop_codon:yes gene_type:complete
MRKIVKTVSKHLKSNHDREVMTKELLALGLHQQLLDGLSNNIIKELFNLIGWASPAFYKSQKERK